MTPEKRSPATRAGANRAGNIRVCRAYAGEIDAIAKAMLASLPEWMEARR